MTALAVARDLFAALDQRGVRYCHWKSNQHVAAGLSGHTDLDVLVDRRHAADALEVLGRCGFKRFDPAMGMGYPAVEDHIALDRDSGLFLHCHLHYRLVAGDRRFKGYRLPWEDLLLERRVWDAEHGLYIADPSLELLVLLVRFAIKLRTRDTLRHAVGLKFVDRKGYFTEFAWLHGRSHRLETLGLCTDLLGERASRALEPLLDAPLNIRELRRFRRAAHAELETLRSHGRVAGTALQWLRSLVTVVAGLSRRYFRLPVPMRRTLPTGGVLVALIGGDPSGRSAVLRDLTRSLRGKVDVLVVSPAAQRAGAALRRAQRRGSLLMGRLGDLGRMVQGVMRAQRARRRLGAAWRARSLGMVVLANQYPQTPPVASEDGPPSSGQVDRSGRLRRWLARLEAAPAAWAARHPPDLVLRLNVPAPNSAEPAPELAVYEPGPRSVLSAGRSPRRTCVVDINAARPLPEVARDVIGAVWDQL